MQQSTNSFGQPLGEPLPDWKPPESPRREILRGTFCCLEPLDAGRHALDLHAAQRDGDDAPSWTYMPYGPFESTAAYADWIVHNGQGSDPLFYAIIDRVVDKPFGVASYLNIHPERGSIEVGHIHYAAALKQTPIATEAMALMMAHAFELGYRRYEWKCDALNAASRRAAERLGFRFEGVFRQATVYKQRNRDTAWYSVTDHEWPRLQAIFSAWLDPENFDVDGRQRRKLSGLTRSLNQTERSE